MGNEKKSITEKYVTSKGEVVGFVALQKPSTKFNKEGIYSVNVLVSKEEGEALAAKIKAIRTEQFKTHGKGTKVAELTRCVPYTTVNEEGEEIADEQGRYIIKASAKAYIKNDKPTNKIGIVDSKLTPINKEISIGEGTIVKLGLELTGYSVAGKTGVSVKLKIAQIIDLVSFSKGASISEFGLTSEDGFDFTADADETATSTEEATEDDEGEEAVGF